MDLSLLPTPSSEHNNQRTGACFTVRSANSPSYRLTRRPGVRTPLVFSEEERQGTDRVGERERSRTHTGTNCANKEENRTVTGEAKTGSSSTVKGQCEEKEASGYKMSTKLNHNGTTDNTATGFGTDKSGNPISETRGRTEWRRHNLSSRSKSLDWRTGEKSPDRGKRADMLSAKTGEDISKQGGGLDVRRTRIEGVRTFYNSPGTSNVVRESSPVSHMSETLNRASRGNSLPSRMRSQSGSGSGVRGTSTSFGPKGGHSILERIEKLYGSAGFDKTEDCSLNKDLSTPVTSHRKETTTDFPTSAQQTSYEGVAGGTFPRCFSSGAKRSHSPVQSGKSFTSTQKDSSETLSPATRSIREKWSGGQWQGDTRGRYSEVGGVHSGRGSEQISTRSLDGARSRWTVAPQITSARAVGGIASAPQSNTFLEEERSVSMRDSSGVRDRRASGSKDQGRVNHGEEKGETNGINGKLRERTGGLKEQEKEKDTDDGPKQKTELKGSLSDEDVFEPTQKITLKTIEKKKCQDIVSGPSAASVRNKINQFEALTQRSQGLTTGKVLMSRRALSVPTKLSSAYDGVKKSGSARVIDALRGKWEGLKEGGEAGEITEEKVTGAGKKLGSERSLSVDEVGLALGRKEREWNNEVKETDDCKNCTEDFGKYSRLKTAQEMPLNGGAQRCSGNVYIDETDFSKVSSPEKTCERPPSSLLSNSGDTSTGVQKTAVPSVMLPVCEEEKTPTNTPNHSAICSPAAQPENATPFADSENESISVHTQAASTPEPEPQPLSRPLTTLSHSNLPDLISPDVKAAHPNRKKPALDMNAWVAGLNTKIKVWNDEDDYEDDDDDDSTQKDEDSNYDSDSGESSVTITSNMSQSDHRSFSVSLSDLCNFAGVDYESENDSDEWQSTCQRTASLSSDASALSCVSVMPSEELDRLLEDVRSLGDSNLQDYDDVQVVVLHKEVGVGLGFSLAGGVDQNKPVTVHKVFHSGVAAQEGSIREGYQVLSINGTALCGYAHWEALRVLRKAKTRELGVVVLRRGGIYNVSKGGVQTNNQGTTQTQFTETGQHVCVHLEKNSRDLGFSLEGGVGSSPENRPLTVQKIFHGGPVDKVFPGDEVVEIGGVSVVGMRRLEAWTLIRRLAPGPVDVVLRRTLRHPKT